MSQTPIDDQLRGERTDADAPATGADRNGSVICTGSRTGSSPSTSSPRGISVIAIFSEPEYIRLELSIMLETLPSSSGVALPAVKFFKDAVEDILAGRKTLEPRPRSLSWTRRLEKVGQALLTYGPRFGAPTVFAVARITDVTVRPFDSVTLEDLRRIGYDWADRSREEFVAECTRWFARELEKNYPVAWISFEVIDQ